MGFQIKDFVSIAASMVNYAKATQQNLTDFNVGSVARTLMDSPAIEIEELYQRIFSGLLDAIPVSTYLSFGFDKLPEVTAFGYVTVTALAPLSANIDIPAGTAFDAVDGRTYQTVDPVVWDASDASVRLLVRSAESGAAGNIGSGQITQSTFFVGTPVSIDNAMIATGRDLESEDDRAVRFSEFIKSLSRGTGDSILYAVRQVVIDDEYVTRAGLENGGGRIRVYLYTSKGLPSSALQAHAQRVIDGYRDDATGIVYEGYVAAGIRADVRPMIETPISMTAYVSMLSGYQLDSAKINELRDSFSSFVSSIQSGSVLLIDELRDRLLAVAGVLRIVLATDSNIVCQRSEVLVPGMLTVEPLNG